MKKWIISQVILVFTIAIIGQISKLNFSSCGIADIRNIEDTYNFDCGLMFYFGDNKNTGDTEVNIYNNLLTYEDDYVNDLALASIVIIGHSTGNLFNRNQSLGQEIVVEKVIIGSDIIEGEKYYVYSIDDFELNSNKKPVYTSLKNLMDPDCKYLIFLEPSELNGISPENTYCLKGAFFSYLNLSRNTSYPITKPIDDVKYSEVRDTEYFAQSQRIIDQLCVIKERIIDKYIVK